MCGVCVRERESESVFPIAPRTSQTHQSQAYRYDDELMNGEDVISVTILKNNSQNLPDTKQKCSQLVSQMSGGDINMSEGHIKCPGVS